MSEELKPCPFCEGEEIEIAPGLKDDWYIGCLTCDYQIRCKHSTEEDTVRYWNTRPAEDALKAENERMKEELARHRLANMKFKKFINEDLFYVLTRYLPKKQVFSEIIGLLRLKYDRIEAITEKGGENNE